MLSTSSKPRKGVIAVLTAFLLILLLGMVACAFDFGWILMTRTQLQAAADSAALAGGTALPAGLGDYPVAASTVETDAKQGAEDFAKLNRNGDQLASYLDKTRDVQVGWAVFNGGTGLWEKHYGEQLPVVGGYNLVRVTMHRDQTSITNGDRRLPLIFGPILGQTTKNLTAVATAVIMPAKGIRIEAGSSVTANVMPFTLDEYVWQKYLLAQKYFDANTQTAPAPDNIVVDASDISRGWYNVATGMWYATPSTGVSGSAPTNSEPLFGHYVTQGNNTTYVADFSDQWRMSGATPATGTDTLLEIDIFPRDDYTAGNFGTMDIGSDSGSTTDIERQIRYGVNATDLSFYPPNYQFSIPRTTTGDTGISAGFKDALDSVAGQCRAVYLFRGNISGTGTNASFDLRAMAGVRVMHTELTGSMDFKQLRVQRCDLTLVGGIADTTTQIGTGTTVFTPLILIE